jgi:hypothetical protein
MGPIHFLMIDTEMDLGAESDQYAFVKADLDAVDRAATPWVVAAGHRPMYTSSSTGPFADPRMQVLEPLFLDGNVNLALWGHVHNAQVTCPLNNSSCVGVGDAPQHAVVGNGGQSTSYFNASHTAPFLEWSAETYGWWTLDAVGKESLVLTAYSDVTFEAMYTLEVEA